MFLAAIKKHKEVEKETKRIIKFSEEVQLCLECVGLTGVPWYSPSMEDFLGFPIPDQHWFNSPPISLKHDRRWYGFPELTECDTQKNYILPEFYDFNP